MQDEPRAGMQEFAVIYVGAVAPDTPQYRGAAFSPAGHLFQVNLLNGFIHSGRRPVAILGQVPRQSFPQDRTLWQKPMTTEISEGLLVHFVPYLNLPVLRQLTVGLAVSLQIWRIARRVRPARLVVCSYNLSEPPGLFTLIGARLAGAKAIPFVCDVYRPGVLVPDSWSRRLDFAMQRWLLPRFDGLIVVNDQIAEDFAPRLPAIRVEGGVTARMLGAHLSRRKADPDSFTMVYAGRLDSGNGIEEVLEAMRRLPDLKYRLRLAGAGPLEPLVQEAVSRDERIQYLGMLAFDAVANLYDSADLLLNIRLTKRLDTRYFFPSKLMEYLASGVPVLTTCPGKIREEFSELAFLLEDESSEALARTISEVAALPSGEREQRGRAAREFMANHRSWNAQARRILAFMRDQLR